MTKKTLFQKIDKIVTIILIIFVVLMAVMAGMFTYVRAKNGLVKVFGYSILYVMTGSMAPTINVGEVILIKEVSEDQIKEQDIITYKSEEGLTAGQYITHRVIQIIDHDGALQFVTEGDANNGIADIEYVNYAKIVGIYQGKVAFVQFLISILGNIYVFLIFIILPLFIILVMNLINFVKTIKNIDDDSVEIKKTINNLTDDEKKQLEKYIEEQNKLKNDSENKQNEGSEKQDNPEDSTNNHKSEK